MKYPTAKKIFFYSAIIILLQSLIVSQTNSTETGTAPQNSQSQPDIRVDTQALPLKENTNTEKDLFWNSFVSGFSIIFSAEIGDRTFILIMIYAVSNSYLKTFLIANFVLLLWNYLSIIIGYAMPLIMNRNLLEWIGIITFSFFGVTMIIQGYSMESKYVEEEFIEEEENLIKQKQLTTKVHSSDSHDHDHPEAQCSHKHESCKPHDLSNKINNVKYITNDNDLTEKLLNKKKEDLEKNKKKEAEKNLFDSFWAFGISVFMAEFGDKSQIAAIVIGATQNFYGVLLGTSLAHMLCTVIAIAFGKIFSKYVTTKQITILGGIIFLLFAALFLIEKLLA